MPELESRQHQWGYVTWNGSILSRVVLQTDLTAKGVLEEFRAHMRGCGYELDDTDPDQCHMDWLDRRYEEMKKERDELKAAPGEDEDKAMLTEANLLDVRASAIRWHEGRIAELEAELFESQNTALARRNRIAELEKERDRLKEKVNAFLSDDSSLRKERDELKADLDSARERIKLLEENSAAAQIGLIRERDELKTALNEKKEVIEFGSAHNKTLKKERDALKEDLIRAFMTAQANEEKLIAERDELKAERDSLLEPHKKSLETWAEVGNWGLARRRIACEEFHKISKGTSCPFCAVYLKHAAEIWMDSHLAANASPVSADLDGHATT